jgi:hypothetical protein
VVLVDVQRDLYGADEFLVAVLFSILLIRAVFSGLLSSSFNNVQMPINFVSI